MNSTTPSSWSSHVTKAVGTLVLVAIVLSVIEHVFVDALPGLLVVLALLGVIRLASGFVRRSRW